MPEEKKKIELAFKQEPEVLLLKVAYELLIASSVHSLKDTVMLSENLDLLVEAAYRAGSLKGTQNTLASFKALIMSKKTPNLSVN